MLHFNKSLLSSEVHNAMNWLAEMEKPNKGLNHRAELIQLKINLFGEIGLKCIDFSKLLLV